MPGISRPFEAYLDEMRTITVLVPKSRASSCSPPFLLEDDQGERIELSVKAQVELEEQFKYVLESTAPFHSEEFTKYAVKKASGQTCKSALLREARRLTRLFFMTAASALFIQKEVLYLRYGRRPRVRQRSSWRTLIRFKQILFK